MTLFHWVDNYPLKNISAATRSKITRTSSFPCNHKNFNILIDIFIMSTQRDLHFRLQITLQWQRAQCWILVNPSQTKQKLTLYYCKSPGNLGYVRETFEFFASWDRKELYVFEIVSIRLLQNVGYPLLFIYESIEWLSYNLWKSPTDNHILAHD